MLKPAHDGYHRFSLAAAGKSSLYLDGALVAEGLREAIRFIDGPSYAPQAVIPLITGQPVTIRVKYETGPAIALVLQVWYPGEQLGTALARVPFGDDDPGATLPVTFPAHTGHGPVQAAEQYPGIGGVATYTEDILVRYRFFAVRNRQAHSCLSPTDCHSPNSATKT